MLRQADILQMKKEQNILVFNCGSSSLGCKVFQSGAAVNASPIFAANPTSATGGFWELRLGSLLGFLDARGNKSPLHLLWMLV